jgi:hypothetical protein
MSGKGRAGRISCVACKSWHEFEQEYCECMEFHLKDLQALL